MRILLIILVMGLLLSVKSQNFITPTIITTLPEELNETSGLINLDGDIWTHTDNGGQPELYQINLTNGNIIRTVEVHNANNVDWEDIACDEAYVYIGDFGNNDGSRTNLKVYRISRADIASSNDVDAEKIHFSYSDQINFEPNYHATNFDCEAMTCFQDKLYLFTKNWIDNQTNVYELSNEPGTYVAVFLTSFNTNCLITGAELIPALNTLLLIGYNESGGSYTWLFTNFSGPDLFEGSNSKLIWTMLTQVEGICYAGNSNAYASSEKFAGELDPALFSLDLAGYMSQIYVPAHQQVQISIDHDNILVVAESGKILSGNLQIFTLDGRVLANQKLKNESVSKVPIHLSAGIYLARYQERTFQFTTKLIIF